MEVIASKEHLELHPQVMLRMMSRLMQPRMEVYLLIPSLERELNYKACIKKLFQSRRDLKTNLKVLFSLK